MVRVDIKFDEDVTLTSEDTLEIDYEMSYDHSFFDVSKVTLVKRHPIKITKRVRTL